MSFPADTQLGPYQIVALIGSGGMGEVYRARDTRLLRDVAVKVLPASFTNDAERLRRFEQEARAVAALNHPNIVSVYDVGTEGDVHYIVSELLEGDTLRQRISPAGMAQRKATELAVQLANGLAAAHDQGIIHRDLKPENIFITRNGHLKILDFGLAKLRRPTPQTETVDGATAIPSATDAGQVLGTVGYMSPEQVRGAATDHRSDIFSFGSILYEMLSGQRAFKRNTSAETMTAILNEDPQDFPSRTIGAIAPALERIVRHCLEKQPGQRFQSSHDIAFDLESLSGISATAATPAEAPRRRWLRPVLAALVLLAAGLGLGAWLRPAGIEVHPKLHRITFRRGTIWGARFTPDGNLIYGAAWEGRPTELFAAKPGGTESRPVGMQLANILAVAPSGDLAILMNQHYLQGWEYPGMLARTPQAGGAPREISDNVEWADWSPDGASLAVVRRIAGKVQVEYPLGNVLYEMPGWISHPRVSPEGKFVAFIDHTYVNDDAGAIMIVDRAGNKKVLANGFVSAQGLAWSPNGNEVWFTATDSGVSRELHAVTLDGKQRLVYFGTGTLTLHDISKDGRVLFTREDLRAGVIALAPGETKERDLSWHDWTIPRDISNDGKLMSFDETGEAGGETGGLYVRPTDGSPATRLGDGVSPSLSPDGKWVVALGPGPRRAVMILPIGAGESRAVSTGDVQVHQVFFFPDSRHLLEAGSASGEAGLRLWVQDPQNGPPRPITPDGVSLRYHGAISPDGKSLAALDPQGKPTIYDIAGGPPTPVPNAGDGDEPVQWTADGKSLLVGRSELPNRVYLIDLATRERKLFRTFTPPDPTGLVDNAPPNFSRDLKSYVYSYTRITSDLYVVDGLK
jgi:eukaryotic-like serine/threonine-protein kinase